MLQSTEYIYETITHNGLQAGVGASGHASVDPARLNSTERRCHWRRLLALGIAWL